MEVETNKRKEMQKLGSYEWIDWNGSREIEIKY
jgi:hypothetical protein